MKKKRQQPVTGPWDAPVRDLIGSLDAAARRSLRRKAAGARLRQAARAAEHLRLIESHGSGAPEVAASARRLELAQRSSVLALGAVRTAAAGAQLGDDVAVLGQATARGVPIPGATVFLTDERGSANAVATTVTDGGGWFALTVSPQRYQEFFAKSKQLTLVFEGGPLKVHHLSVQPLPAGESASRFMTVDVPPAAIQTPAAPTPAPRPAPPAKVYLATGARGELVRRAQMRLGELGFDPRGTDGAFGPRTAGALEAFQKNRGLAASGAVDEPTWRALFDAEPPSALERALAVTASFEGHGFTQAAGNWDDAGITFGIIGFTLRHGGLGKVVKRVHESRPGLLEEDFGPQRSRTLLEALERPAAERVSWADSISLKDDKATLHKPWQEAFARFGARPEAQAAQLAVAEEDYAKPARRTASELGLKSELGLALAFDAQVQNGGVKAAARRRIEAARAEKEPADERELRRLVAHAVADAADARFRQDVLDRKLTLAEGEGTVHGRRYVLRNWGLDETPLSNPSSSSSQDTP